MERKGKDQFARPKSRQSLAHVPSKSNTTTDVASIRRAEEAKSKSQRSRGKSLGPGGLEALTETNANVLKIAPPFQPKSILKPSIPLTPPKTIPSFDELHKKNSVKTKSPLKNGVDDLLIDFSTPAPATAREGGSAANVPGVEPLVDPFSPVGEKPSHSEQSRVATVQEEDQRRAEKKAILDQRAARRKSMANRRVSFAPEATLHTWSVMELMEDSTTSSTSNSTRRQSSVTAAQSPMLREDAPAKQDGRPITPVEQVTAEDVQDTPESQRELHQRKRRRTSDITQSSDDDDVLSSPGDGGDSSPIRVEDSVDSESDTDGDTAMSLDEATQLTVRSSDSSGTQTSLDERLRQAASQAGTRGIDYDENGALEEDEDDQSMEIADGTVTHAFRQYAPKDLNSATLEHESDKENFNHLQRGTFSNTEDEDEDDMDDNATMDMEMDMTRAVGGIVTNGLRKQPASTHDRPRSNATRRTSSGADTSYGDETMDLTVAKGGILANIDHHSDETADTSDEDITMEMTNVIGGLKMFRKRESWLAEETEAMDMTMAAGGILAPIEEQTEPASVIEDGMTGAMDMTRAIGAILPVHETTMNEEEEADSLELQNHIVSTPAIFGDQDLGRTLAASNSTTRQLAASASETGSPTLRPRLSARRAALDSRSTTPKSVPSLLSPRVAAQLTPSKQLTPAPAKSTSPKRTPILAAGVTTRSASPKKLFVKELKERASPATKKSPRRHQDLLFSKDESTGQHTPRVVLHASKPHQHLRRRSSGIGVDVEGIGSPRVSEILSRRASIGEVAPEFQLQQGQNRQIHFQNPQVIEHEIDAERAEEHRRESGRFIMEQEASGQQDENTTQNLKDMIESMTPRKEKKAAKAKGRKSLAIGSARGLLGKRPAELDDEDEEEFTPKRLKTVSREGSPIKKVHLPKPPTKAETTGRLSKAEQLQLALDIQSISTPILTQSPIQKVKSPERTGRFRDPVSAQKPTSFEAKLDNVIDATDVFTTHPEANKAVADEEKISLQQFLNMTNVHFIELSTTKRRHTTARINTDADVADSDDGSQNPFVAAATTLPLLELYQHATRELKTYISSGRKIVRQIEAETLAEQPAIFKEYVDARPDAKAVMDNQFRNGKTNARLQSKEGWYMWRGQLVDGLRSGLEGIKSDMEKDKLILEKQSSSLSTIVPSYATKKQHLEKQLKDLRRRLDEFETFDHAALKVKRQDLAGVDDKISDQERRLFELQRQMNEKDEVLSQAAELRQEMADQINEAMRVQEEQRRWHSKDVANHKAAVQKLEYETGWELLTAEEDKREDSNDFGVALTMRYQGQLRLFFYPSAFQSKSDEVRRRSGRRSRSVSGPTAPLSLAYSAVDDDDDNHPAKELPTEQRFFLQLIQGQLHAFTMMPRGSITCQSMLKTVSKGWSLAQKVVDEIHQLNKAGIVRISIMSDEKLKVILTLMHGGRSRVDIEFILTVSSLNDGEMTTSTTIVASPLYGSSTSIMDVSKTKKVQHALLKEIESREIGEGSWIRAVKGFEDWLEAQILSQSLSKADSLKPRLSARPQHSKSSGPEHGGTLSKTDLQRVRATTQSPQRSTTPKVPPPRSPLAPRTANSKIQKKTLPVPKKSVQLSQVQSQQESMIPIASYQKENFVPGTAAAKIVVDPPFQAQVEAGMNKVNFDDVFGVVRPAITPEMQEAMMHTPVKRRAGALRRSPM